MEDTQRSQPMSPQLHQIAKQAREHPERVFTSLAHLITVDLLREAYEKTRKDSAAGPDGVTAAQYGQNLEANLAALHQRLQEQTYNAPPVRRCWIEKEGGKKRPLGIPTFEDKIVQRAVSLVMSAVYEQDFHTFSHGFREGHSPHQAIREIREECFRQNIHWIVDADVSSFFDSLDHEKLKEIIKKPCRVGLDPPFLKQDTYVKLYTSLHTRRHFLFYIGNL